MMALPRSIHQLTRRSSTLVCCKIQTFNQNPRVGASSQVRTYNATDEAQTVVLHFHGGAYVTGQGRPNDNIRVGAGMLAKHLKAEAFAHLTDSPPMRMVASPPPSRMRLPFTDISSTMESLLNGSFYPATLRAEIWSLHYCAIFPIVMWPT